MYTIPPDSTVIYSSVGLKTLMETKVLLLKVVDAQIKRSCCLTKFGLGIVEFKRISPALSLETPSKITFVPGGMIHSPVTYTLLGFCLRFPTRNSTV